MGNIKNFIKQKIKNAAANGIGKFTAKKLDSETKKSFLKGLLSGGKRGIDSFIINIEDIQPGDVFLSEVFLEKMIKAIEKVKKPKRFNRYIGSYRKIFDMWERTKKELLEKFKTLKECIELNNVANREINDFWEKNKEILSDMKTAQKRTSELDDNKNRLQLVSKELAELQEKQKRLQNQYESGQKRYEESKKEAETKKHELQKKMLDLYIDEKNKLEQEREDLKKKIEMMPDDLPELELKRTEKSYENLKKNLENKQSEALEEKRQRAKESLGVLEERYKDDVNIITTETKPLLVLKALINGKSPKPNIKQSAAGEKTIGTETIDTEIKKVNTFIKTYNNHAEKLESEILPEQEWLKKELKSINGNGSFNPEDYTEQQFVDFYDWVENTLSKRADRKAQENWVKLKLFWRGAVAEVDKAPGAQKTNTKIMTVKSLKSENWQMVKQHRLNVIVTDLTNKLLSDLREYVNNPETEKPDINLNAILEYIVDKSTELKMMDKIILNEEEQTYKVLSELFTTDTIDGVVENYKDAKKAWTTITEYCSRIASHVAPKQDVLYRKAELIMELLTKNRTDEDVQKEVNNVLEYVSAYNAEAKDLKQEQKRLKKQYEKDYLKSYPALTDVSHSDYGALITNSRLYHIAKVYLGLIHPVDQTIEKRKQSLLESLDSLGINFQKTDIELILNFINKNTENPLATQLAEPLDQLKKEKKKLDNITREHKELTKQINGTLNYDQMDMLQAKVNTKIVLMGKYIANVLMTLSDIRKVVEPYYQQCVTVLSGLGQVVEKDIDPNQHGFQPVMKILDFVCHLYGYIEALLDKQKKIGSGNVIIEKPNSFKKVIKVLHKNLICRDEIYNYVEKNSISL